MPLHASSPSSAAALLSINQSFFWRYAMTQQLPVADEIMAQWLRGLVSTEEAVSMLRAAQATDAPAAALVAVARCVTCGAALHVQRTATGGLALYDLASGQTHSCC
jgi:hypothetical protein